MVNQKYPNTRITISQKCANIFVLSFAHSFGTQMGAVLCCIYLTYGKLTETEKLKNFKKEFCNCTDYTKLILLRATASTGRYC